MQGDSTDEGTAASLRSFPKYPDSVTTFGFEPNGEKLNRFELNAFGGTAGSAAGR
jgi:hypothetical protein